MFRRFYTKSVRRKVLEIALEANRMVFLDIEFEIDDAGSGSGDSELYFKKQSAN